MTAVLDRADQALVLLLRYLEAHSYSFITVSPSTHRRVLRRAPDRLGDSLRDVFGWNVPFDPATIDREVVDLLEAAGLLRETPRGLKSGVRASSLDNLLLLHSSFPTDSEDAVFFGPDTYRFAAFLHQELGDDSGAGLVVDIGAGSGAGGLVAARYRPQGRLVLSDVNEAALRLARVNAAHNGVEAAVMNGEGLSAVTELVSLAVANPPFIAGSGERTYRDGGDMHGARLSLDWAVEAMDKLAPGGQLLLYTGSAIIDGADPLRDALAVEAQARHCSLRYRELDPDIFGRELTKPAYEDADRIAAVGATITRLS